MRSCLPRTIYAFWFFSYWPPLHSSLCFKFNESQIACVYLGSPCERIQSVVAWSYALEQNIPVTDRNAWEEMGVPHLMTPMQSRHPGSQEAAEPLLEGTKSRYCSKEATPLSVYPQVIWISFYQVLIAHSQPLSIALCLILSVLNVGREFSPWRLFACSLRCLPPDGATETSRQAIKISYLDYEENESGWTLVV